MDRIIKIYRRIANFRPSGFWLGFVVGFVYFSYIFSWIWAPYSLDALGVTNGFMGFILILFVFSLTVICAAFFWGLFSFFGRRLVDTQTKQWATLFYLASIFVLVEYLRSWAFGILWLGSGSILGPHWTFGNLAYLFVNFELITKSSSIWGIYGIDFILALIAGVLFILVTQKYPKNFMRNILLFSFIVILIDLFLITKNPLGSMLSPNISVTLVQTKEPTKVQYTMDELISNYTQKVKLTKEAGNAMGEGLIVLPENANFSKTLSSFLDRDSSKKYFNNLSPEELIIVDNNILPDQDNYKSRTLLISSQNGVVGFYDKQLLSPFGEYLPYIMKPFLLLFEKGDSIFKSSGLSAGGSNPLLLNYEDVPVKILACSDVLSPGISSEGQYGLLISLQNLGIFKENHAIASQILSILRFRAAENNKYAVLASNYGRSYVINNSGSIIKSTDSPGYQILTADIVPNKERTWYNKLGDFPILLLSLAVFGLGFKKLIR